MQVLVGFASVAFMQREKEACKFLFQFMCIDLARTDILQIQKPQLKWKRKTRKKEVRNAIQ